MSDTPDDKTPAQPIGDDVIMVYADGVRAPDLRPAVRDALARDPALMQRFEGFLFTRGPLATSNPWKAKGLEWLTTSPPMGSGWIV